MSRTSVVEKWVDEAAALTKPSKVIWADGSKQEYDRLVEDMLSDSTLLELNQQTYPGCYLRGHVVRRFVSSDGTAAAEKQTTYAYTYGFSGSYGCESTWTVPRDGDPASPSEVCRRCHCGGRPDQGSLAKAPVGLGGGGGGI